jgi:hypothetical protein
VLISGVLFLVAAIFGAIGRQPLVSVLPFAVVGIAVIVVGVLLRHGGGDKSEG